MRQRGFTIIEVLISMLIWSLYAAAAWTTYYRLYHGLLCYAGQVRFGCQAVIVTDERNGCQYAARDGSITPRLKDGKQVGCK